MFFYINIIISIIGLIIATYTDLKERIVPNKLNFSLAIIGLLIHLIWSIYSNSIYPIAISIIGLCFGFFFAWILWKIGVFAGGDVKLFMGLGALNPFTPALLNIGLFTNISIPIFPITLFLYSLIGFLPYGLFVIITKLFKKKKEREIIFAELKENSIKGIHVALFVAFIHLIFLTYLNFLGPIIEIITLILFGIILHKLGDKRNIVEFLFLIAAIIINGALYIQLFLATAVVIIFLYGTLKLLLSSRILLSSEVKISDLEEGMIPGFSLIKKGKKVVEVEGLSLKKIINYTIKGKANKIISEDNEIVSANKARGLTKEEIKELKKLNKKKLIKDKIKIKESMPFVPTMLISYILCLILGDFLILILMGL
jgi:preflagellin peptidase FlaK